MSSKKENTKAAKKSEKNVKKEQPTAAAMTAAPLTKEAIKEKKAAIQAELKEWKEKEHQLSKKAPLVPSWKKLRDIVQQHPELRNNMDKTIRAAILLIPDIAVVTLCIQYRKYREKINATK